MVQTRKSRRTEFLEIARRGRKTGMFGGEARAHMGMWLAYPLSEHSARDIIVVGLR
jgi:hypothetical protein